MLIMSTYSVQLARASGFLTTRTAWINASRSDLLGRLEVANSQGHSVHCRKADPVLNRIVLMISRAIDLLSGIRATGKQEFPFQAFEEAVRIYTH